MTVIRLHFIVDGQTAETFVNQVLKPLWVIVTFGRTPSVRKPAAGAVSSRAPRNTVLPSTSSLAITIQAASSTL